MPKIQPKGVAIVLFVVLTYCVVQAVRHAGDATGETMAVAGILILIGLFTTIAIILINMKIDLKELIDRIKRLLP